MSHRRPRHSPRHRHTMPQTAARDTGNYSTSNGQQSRYAHTSSYHPPPPYRDRDFPGGPRTGLTFNDQQHLHVQSSSYHSEPPPGGHFSDRSVVSHSPMTNHYQQNPHAQNSPYPSAPVRGGRYLKDDLRPASNGSATYAEGAPIGQYMAYGTHGLKFRNTNVNIVGPDQQSIYDHSSDLHINGGRHRVTRRGSGNTSGTTAPQPGRQSAFTGARGNVIENATIELIAGSESTGQYYHNYPY